MNAASPILAVSPRRRLVIYVAALVGMFMAVLDMQIVATALPTIAGALGNLELFGWVGAAYILATAAVTPFYGKLGDLFGRKRVFIFAIALFSLGSLACGLATSMEGLVAARVVQGLGGGGLMTSAFAIMADLFEPRERARFQGYSAGVFTLSGLCGPVAGGVIAQTIGWQFIFLINIPIAVAVIGIIIVAMPNISTGRRPAIDYAGGLLLASAVTLAVFWAEFVLGGSSAGPLPYILPPIFIAAGLAFVLVERRAPEPILPLRLFRDSTISIALAISVVVGISTLGTLNYFALFLQTVTGLSPALAGLLFLPASTGSLIASIGAGTIVSRTGRYKLFPIASMSIGAVVMVLFTFVVAETPVWAIAMLMFCFSAAMGMQMQTLMVAAQNAAPRADVGAVTGSVTLARMVGASFGLAANGGLLTAALASGEAGVPEFATQLPAPIRDLTPNAIQSLPPDVAVHVVEVFGVAFDAVFYFGAAMFGIGLVLALLLKDVRLPVQGDDSAAAASIRH